MSDTYRRRPTAHGKKVAHGVAWSSLGRLGTQALQFGATLVLARLLTPSEFGLVASVYVITGFAVIFFEMGASVYLVQLKDLSEEDLSTVFWVNALGGLVFALLLWGAGPLIAAFFHQPQLSTLAPIVGLQFTVHLAVVHLAILQRQMRFKALSLIELVCAAVGFAVSIIGAVCGLGVYALALGPVVQQLAFSVLMWSLVDWRPRRWVSLGSLKRLWFFSWGLLGFNVMNYWTNNIDNLSVGRVSGPAELGFYNRSYNFMLLPVLQVSSVLGRVMLPALSKVQGDHSRVRSQYRRALQAANILVVPVLVGVAVTSPGLVPLLWGDQWVPMTPYLALLCIAGIPQCLSTSVVWIFQSQDRTRELFYMGLVISVVGVTLVVGGAVLAGTIGVAWAVVARSWLSVWPEASLAGRIISLKPIDVLKDNLPVLVISSAMAAVVWLVPAWIGQSRTAPASVLVQAVAGAVTYGGALLMVRRDLVVSLANLFRR